MDEVVLTASQPFALTPDQVVTLERVWADQATLFICGVSRFHTPDALEAAVKEAKDMDQQLLLVVAYCVGYSCDPGRQCSYDGAMLRLATVASTFSEPLLTLTKGVLQVLKQSGRTGQVIRDLSGMSGLSDLSRCQAARLTLTLCPVHNPDLVLTTYAHDTLRPLAERFLHAAFAPGADMLKSITFGSLIKSSLEAYGMSKLTSLPPRPLALVPSAPVPSAPVAMAVAAAAEPDRSLYVRVDQQERALEMQAELLRTTTANLAAMQRLLDSTASSQNATGAKRKMDAAAAAPGDAEVKSSPAPSASASGASPSSKRRKSEESKTDPALSVAKFEKACARFLRDGGMDAPRVNKFFALVLYLSCSSSPMRVPKSFDKYLKRQQFNTRGSTASVKRVVDADGRQPDRWGLLPGLREIVRAWRKGNGITKEFCHTEAAE